MCDNVVVRRRGVWTTLLPALNETAIAAMPSPSAIRRTSAIFETWAIRPIAVPQNGDRKFSATRGDLYTVDLHSAGNVVREMYRKCGRHFTHYQRLYPQLLPF